MGRYTRECKSEAIALATKSHRTHQEIALDLGINPSTFRNWMSEAIMADKRKINNICKKSQADSGKDLGQLLEDIIGCLRALLVSKVDPSADNDGIPQEFWDNLQQSVEAIQTDRLLNLVEIFAQTDGQMKWATNKRLHMEIGVIKAIQSLNDARISDVITALGGVHDVSGSISAEKSAPQPTQAQQQPATDTPTKELQPVPSSTQPEIQSAPIKKEPKKSATIAGSLDKFIDDAEPGSTEPQVPAIVTPAEQKPEQAETKPKEEEAKNTAPDTSIDDEFQNDPLIQQAMDTFQASRIS